MFSGSGLGFLNLTPTGISTTPTLQCITAEEAAEARAKCRIGTLRGLGATHQVLAPMGGRLASISPCDLLNAPICPMPTCIDEYTAGVITQCISGTSTNPDVDCGSLYIGALSQLPYCSRPGGLTPIPQCLTQEQAGLRTYCNTANGTNKSLNALCWAMKHDPSYWNDFMNAPACGPTVIHEPTKRPPAPGPAPIPVPIQEPPSSGTRSSGTMGVAGILALLAVAGGGYYLYRKNK